MLELAIAAALMDLLMSSGPLESWTDLLKNPAVLALLGISSTGGGIAGWLVKGAVSAAKTEARTELEIALESLERAKKTPDPNDDVAAQKHVDTIRRIKAIVDQFPDIK